MRKRTIIKRSVSTVVFLCILAGVLCGVMNLMEKKTAREKYRAFYDSGTNFDVIFMGTSHAYNTILPQEIWSSNGIASYNWAYSNCTPAEDYYILQDVIRNTSPRLVVMDLYGIVEYDSFEGGNGKYRPDRIEQQHVQFDSISLSKSKIAAVKDIFDDYEHRSDFLFNFEMYHYRWKELSREDFEPHYSTEKGAELLLGHKAVKYKEHEVPADFEFTSVCSEYIPRIISYCNDKGIDLLFVYLPYPAVDQKLNIAASFESAFREYGEFDYVNMTNKGILNYKTDIFKDGTHLNYIGAKKVSRWLGDYITAHYPDIADHRNESKYSIWNDDHSDYIDDLITRFQGDDLYECLMLLCNENLRGEILVTGSVRQDFEKDSCVWEFIKESDGRVKVGYTQEEILIEGDEYPLILTVYDSRSDEEVFAAGYDL